MGIVFLNKNFFPLERNDLTFRTSVRRESNFSTYNSLSEELHIYIYIRLHYRTGFLLLLLLLVRTFSRFIEARAIKGDTLCRRTHRAKEKEKKRKARRRRRSEKETRYRGGFSSFQKNGRES